MLIVKCKTKLQKNICKPREHAEMKDTKRSFTSLKTNKLYPMISKAFVLKTTLIMKR